MSNMLRPHDVLVLLKLCVGQDGQLRQMDLARTLGLSQSEITKSLDRMLLCGLYNDAAAWVTPDGTAMVPPVNSRRRGLGRVHRPNLLELLVHGIKYVIPARLGGATRGFRTAWGMAPLAQKIVSNDDNLPVWPDAHGPAWGPAVEPISPSVPFAAGQDPALYELLALVDAIRLGRTRERKIAAELLTVRLA
jgi:hypothetical protein